MRRFQWILIALCFSVTGAAWADSPDPCCAADVNGDGVVDEADVEYCMNIPIPPYPLPPGCDPDGNGVFSASDVLMMTTCFETTCAAAVPSLTPPGAGLAAGLIVAVGAWGHRQRRNGG